MKVSSVVAHRVGVLVGSFVLSLLAISPGATAAIEVSVTASPNPALPGETLDVEITVTNDGLTDRNDVSVILDYPAGLAQLFEVWFDGDCLSTACEPGELVTFTIPTLAAGKGRTFSVPPRVLTTATDGTIIPFDVDVFDDAVLQASASTSITVDVDRGLELAIEESLDPVTPGGLLTYQLTYGLLETSPGAAGVTLSLPLPAGTSFVSASGGGTESGGTVQWSLGGLDPGASGEQQVTVAVDGGLDLGSILVAQALLEDGAANTARYEATTRVEAPTGLTLVMTASPDPVQPGETMDVELTVTNTDALERTGVVLKLDFPDHIEQLFEVWFDGDCPSTACETPERAVFTIGTLAAGAGITFSVPAQVLVNTPDGTVIALEAEVADNSGAFVDGGTGFAVDGGRGLELALEEDRDPVTPGGLLTYDLTYGLLESSPGAAGVTLSLPLPPGTSFVSASDGGAESGGVVQWSLGGLDPGASGERQVTVAVDAGLDPGSTLLAQALLQDLSNNTARYEATTRVQEPSDLTLVMTASPDPAQPGETMDVELTVTNTDTVDHTGVVLTLDFPDHIEQLFEVWFDGDCPSTACETQERALFTIGTLAAGTGITFSVPAQVLPNTVDGTVIALEAEVTDNTGAFVDGGTSFAVDSARGLELALEEDRDPVTPGGLLTYHLTYGLLENGPGAASVTLSLPLPAGTSFVSASDGGAESDGVVQWLLGGLDPGASGERQVTVAVDADLDPGSTLLAQSLLQDGAENTARYQATTRVQEPIGLVLVMTASPDPVQTGETMDVELTVTNTDALARTGVVLTLDFPDHIEQLFEVWFDGDCPSTACETQERGIFTIGTLAAGAGITYSVPAQVLPNTLDGTVIALEAEVTDNSGGFVDGGTSFAVADARVLDLAVTEFDPAVPGCTLTYSLTYGAFATGPGAPGATLEFRLPAQTTFESATNGGVLNGDVVAWDLGSLNPGSGGERRVTVAVGAGLVPGTILTGEARFTDRSLVQNEIRGDTATRVAAQSPLNVRVAISPEPAPPGQTLALLLSVTNTSGVTRSDVELLLEFPDHVAQLFESVFDGDCPSTACETQERAVFLVPTLAPGQTVNFPVPPVIPANTVAGTVVRFDAFASDSSGAQSADSEAFMVGTSFDAADAGDVNADGQVNVGDLIQIIVNWGPCSDGCPGCPADLNLDGTVNVSDLIEVIVNWSA